MRVHTFQQFTFIYIKLTFLQIAKRKKKMNVDVKKSEFSVSELQFLKQKTEIQFEFLLLFFWIEAILYIIFQNNVRCKIIQPSYVFNYIAK